jgi:hypothetical protein
LVILAFAFFQLLENFFLRASRRCSFAHFGKNLLSGCNLPRGETLDRWRKIVAAGADGGRIAEAILLSKPSA